MPVSKIKTYPSCSLYPSSFFKKTKSKEPHATINNLNRVTVSAEKLSPSSQLSTDFIKQRARELSYYQMQVRDAFFKQHSLPDLSTVIKLYKMEVKIFPVIIDAYNKKLSSDIKLIKSPTELCDIVFNTKKNGRQQIIFDDYVHTIYIDLFKEKSRHISIIAIDSMGFHKLYSTYDDFLDYLNDPRMKGYITTILQLNTDVQKSNIGCKYFSLHFAKQALHDQSIIKQHKENLRDGKNRKKSNYREYNESESQHFLQADYYKKSHSSKRINALAQEKKNKIISKKGTLAQVAQHYRAYKNIDGITIGYNTAIDHFRDRRIHEGVVFLKNQLVK